MNITHQQIVDFWSARQNELGPADWSEAVTSRWQCRQRRKLQRCHIIPHFIDGADEPGNLVLLCSSVIAARSRGLCLWNLVVLPRIRGHEFLHGKKPFHEIEDLNFVMQKIHTAIAKYLR